MDPATLPPLSIRTLVFVRGLGGGEVLCTPLADASLASLGGEEEAILEQKICLADHLAAADAETLARFAFPAGTYLREADVLVAREDLPRKIALRTPIAVPTAIVPASPVALTRPREGEARVRAEVWLMILPLGYTGYLALDERFETRGRDDAALQREGEQLLLLAIDRRIGDEVRRLWIARAEGPASYLQLLPTRRSELVPIDLEIDRGDAGPSGRAAAMRRALAEKEKRARAVQILDSVAQPVHVARRGFGASPPPLVGRERELDLFEKLVKGAQEGARQSVLVVGRERVGKSALVHAFIDRELAAGRTPLVWSTSGAALIAGMSGLGQWQERVRRVMQAAADLGAILWFDDLSDLFTERGRSSVDVPSAMRPFLEQGRVTLVGEMHEDQVDRAERRDVAFFASLSRLRVPPLDVASTLEALRARVAWDETRAPDAPRFDDDALAPLVDLADRYLAYESFPGKAFRLYEEVRAMAGRSKRITVDAMFEAASLRTGVPSFLLREDRALVLSDVVEALGARVIGQDEAVRRVAETICVVKAGLQPRGKPLSTFLFVGPTGVGKTELARALAEYLFGIGGRGGERIARFDMSEYMDALAADRLIRGDDRGEGVLTRKVREQPFCVLLLDEIEKAHPMVFDLLLQVCGEGRLTDAAGRTAFFHNAIVIMTSNLGAADRRAAVGFERRESDERGHYERAIAAAFRPEFLNRIDRVVTFADLGKEHRRKLVELAIDKVRRRRGLVEHGVALSVSERAIDRLAEGGFSPKLGARALRRHVEEHLVAKVATELAGFGDPSDVDVDVRTVDEEEPKSDVQLVAGDLRVSLIRRGSSKATHEITLMRDVSEVRRELARLARLDRVVEVREQLRFLIAQLGHGTRQTSDHGELMADHHRLSKIVGEIDRVTSDVRALEDMALEAFFRGEPLASLRKEARAARGAFLAPVVSALVALEPRRDEMTLLLQELDNRRALSHYFPPLVRRAAALRWSLEVHVDRGDREGAPEWPEDRRFGPPRAPEEVVALLADREREPTALLVRARGQDALLLAIEGGLHRFVGLADELTHLFVTRIAPRTTFGDADWPRLDPDPPASFGERVRLPPNRLHDYVNARLGVAQKRTLDVDPSYYWDRFDEIALAHLLLCEEGKLDREETFRGRLPTERDELRAILATQGKIAAIKRYRELTGASLRASMEAIEELERG